MDSLLASGSADAFRYQRPLMDVTFDALHPRFSGDFVPSHYKRILTL